MFIADGSDICAPVHEHARLACLDEAPMTDEEGFDVGVSAGSYPRADYDVAYREVSRAEAGFWFEDWGLLVVLSGRHCVLWIMVCLSNEDVRKCG